MKKASLAILVLAGFVSFNAFAQAKKSADSSIQGVWRVTEREFKGPNAVTNKNPQPNLYIFTRGHYSIVSVTGDKPRPNQPQDLAKATAAELNATWGPFIAQSGTYEVKGGNITLRPLVAKNPTVMAQGSATATSSFKIEGKTLVLVPQAVTQGPNLILVSQRLTRLE